MTNVVGWKLNSSWPSCCHIQSSLNPDVTYFTMFYIVVACSTFGNCVECYDYNVNDVVDAGDCVECASGYILNDVGDACLSKYD